jgi:hypothetical protein
MKVFYRITTNRNTGKNRVPFHFILTLNRWGINQKLTTSAVTQVAAKQRHLLVGHALETISLIGPENFIDFVYAD